MFSFKKNLFNCLLILIFILFIIVFTYSYVWYEDHIYSSNFLCSNIIYIDTFTSLFNDPKLFLMNLYKSISCFDFNYIHILPLLPFFCIFGANSRFGFILGIELFYLLPLFLFLLHMVYKKIIPSKNFSFFNVYVITILFLSVQMHFAALHGLAEIIAFIPLFFLILWSYDIKFEEKVPIKNIFLFSFLLYLVFLLRRFLIVAEIGLVLSLIIFSLYRIFFVNKNKNFKEIFIKLKNILINLIIIPGVIFSLLFFIVQHEYALSTLNVGSIVYEGYSHNYIRNLKEILTYIGKLPLILFSVSLIILFFSKDKNKPFILLLLSNLLIYTILFSFYSIINIYCLFIILCMNLIIIWGMYKSYIFIRGGEN